MAAAGLGATIVPALVLLLAFTFFSLYTVLMKKAIADGSNAIVLAFLRELIACSVLLPVAYYTQRRKADVSQRRFLPHAEDVGMFVGLGALMIWGVQLLSALSLQHISANTYAILAPSVPVFTLGIALVTKYEHFDRASVLSWLKLASILLTAGGALFIALNAYASAKAAPASADGPYRNPIIGICFLLANKLSVSSYPILEKSLLQKYDPLVIVAWGYTFGAGLTLMSVIPCAADPAAWHLTSSGVGAILYSALISSALNYSLMILVNKRTSPVFVMAAYPWQSIATPVLAFLILGAPFTAGDAIGGTIIIAGLALCVWSRWQESRSNGGLGPGGKLGGQHEKLDDEGSDAAPGTPEVGVVSIELTSGGGGGRDAAQTLLSGSGSACVTPEPSALESGTDWHLTVPASDAHAKPGAASAVWSAPGAAGVARRSSPEEFGGASSGGTYDVGDAASRRSDYSYRDVPGCAGGTVVGTHPGRDGFSAGGSRTGDTFQRPGSAEASLSPSRGGWAAGSSDTQEWR
jgi:drug/metabolite transporter (DMT)-like permease